MRDALEGKTRCMDRYKEIASMLNRSWKSVMDHVTSRRNAESSAAVKKGKWFEDEVSGLWLLLIARML